MPVGDLAVERLPHGHVAYAGGGKGFPPSLRIHAKRTLTPLAAPVLVAVQVSSMKMRRAGSRSGWSSNQSSRAVFTSGRSCSAAWAVSFCT